MTEKEKTGPAPGGKPGENTSKNKDEIFGTTEIKIEEMAIDGICGVY